MRHQPPGTDVSITFKSSLIRGRFTGLARATGCERRVDDNRCEREEKEKNKLTRGPIVGSWYRIEI